MKVTDVRPVVVANPWKPWVLILVETDSGLRGIGEAHAGLTPLAGVAAVEQCRRFVVGQDPRRVADTVARVSRGWYLPTDEIRMNVLSGLEMACWDLLGKSLGAPLHQLLGGVVNERVPTYANGWYTGQRDPDSYAEQARATVELGYRALKFDPFGAALGQLGRADERESLDLVAAVRSAVGDDVELMIEGHDRFDVETAIRVGRRLEPFDIAWFEAPVDSSDIAALGQVARAVPVPVAAGERLTTLAEFAALAREGAVRIWQPDTLNVGGVVGIQRVAALAAASGATMAIHSAQGPVCTAVNAHLSACLPNLLVQEHFAVPGPNDALASFTGGADLVDGDLGLPPGHGLGIDVEEERLPAAVAGEEALMHLFRSGWEHRGTGEPR